MSKGVENNTGNNELIMNYRNIRETIPDRLEKYQRCFVEKAERMASLEELNGISAFLVNA